MLVVWDIMQNFINLYHLQTFISKYLKDAIKFNNNDIMRIKGKLGYE
jgi:hypothetical protein